jgi:hypothetical protein
MVIVVDIGFASDVDSDVIACVQSTAKWNKNPGLGRDFFGQRRAVQFRWHWQTQALLQLGFLVVHVLARDRVKLDELKLFRRGALVLARGVEVTRTRRGFELDLFASTFGHFPGSLQFALGLKVGQDGLNAKLVDGAQRGIGDAQTDPALLVFKPETTVLKVGQKAALGLVVRVRDAIPDHGALFGDQANSGHVGFSGQAMPMKQSQRF